MTPPPAIIVLTPKGLETAQKIARLWPGTEIFSHTPSPDAHHTFNDTIATLRTLFAANRPIIALCAAAIVIRALAPLLSSKDTDPPVVALADDATAIVPLLGGHHGGHKIAAAIAREFNTAAAITAAGERHLGTALDHPPDGFRLANPQHYKHFAADLIAGAPVRITGAAPWLATLPNQSDTATHTIHITEKDTPGAQKQLVYHPAVLAVGLGCERGADPDQAIGLVRETLRAAALAPGAVAAVISVDLKADEPAVHQTAQALNVPARFFPAPRLEAETPRLANPSDAVFQAVGCHGVAEAAALAAAGDDAVLAIPKTKRNGVTCAVAAAAAPINPEQIGRPRGELSIVGLGPGDPLWRSHHADATLAAAGHLVGFGPYLDLIGPLAQEKTCHAFKIGEEVDRAVAALDLAAQGERVALVCSGDPGIYAMASLVFEQIHREDRPEWKRIAVSVIPGLSALQTAAAKIGAPIGHDFAAVSLSDALTPWDVIEKRLEGAVAAGFVLALYNPISTRRARQFDCALEIIRRHRSPDTPVVVARNIARDGESIRVTPLKDIIPGDIDMLTILLIGNDSTCCFPHAMQSRVYTPRGYFPPREGSESPPS